LDEVNPLYLTGTETEFTKLCPKDVIVLHDGDKAEVEKVISDTELILRKGFKSLELITEGVSKYKCVPHIEQGAVYNAVHKELNNNGCITIFPEGGSHDRVEMLPLKGKICSFFFPS
jgi:glycerol-3-phosphate O-acyltransferase/dihydroxyacetone phosphate acyltransferase